MSASCQKRTHAPQQTRLFDYLVGAGEQRRRSFKAEGLADSTDRDFDLSQIPVGRM